MKVGVMQPYFLPYIGYFQLIAAVDLFVIYDNIKYTKKGWINRNRFLQNGGDEMFSLPLRKGSDSLDICERELAADFDKDRFMNQLRGAYFRAPYFEQTFSLIERVLRHSESNLFLFLRNGIEQVCAYLGISTKIITSSEIEIDHRLRGQDRVLALSSALAATIYINPIGGVELYSKKAFLENGLKLQFIQSKKFEYLQFNNAFVPWLSIVDVLMFNSVDLVKFQLLQFDIV
ncbi:WbqC family protein [Polynucleobacter sp. 71A-WALBACH]|uniref:WbqC family protein n=1 Tax=Polynucleobacter sp. 71A-WALBACH TaxID=2689097 RepID=UPI001C0BF074|nr:WbqC family protein [Polynucleobacter sp. 71A-WALBACH]MBU3593272.1 WbqC family protein [Polynucleobacter sp. 71A-WALBACH]